MISSVTYTGDGATRIFPVAFEIQGENYVVVFINDVAVNDRTTYDIINNSIVFVEDSIPAAFSNIEIVVASSPTELGDLDAPPSITQTVLDNLDNINIIANNIDLLRNTANGEYIVSGLPETAALGDLAVNVLDGKIYEYQETGWVVVAISAEGGGTIGDGTSPIVPIEPTLPPAGTEGEFIYNTTDGQFYVYIDGEWKYITAPPTEGNIGIVVVSILPETPTEDQIVFLTTDNKLYRYTIAGGWAEVISPTGAAAEVADASITTAKFAAGITPVEVVATLPTTGNFVGRTVVLTTDGKLYRYAGSAFTAAVPTQDLTGTIIATQIADDAITTPKIAAGAITADEIGANAITSDKITANAITTAKISAGAIGASQIAAGAITTDKIYAGAVAADKIAANAIDATKISAGAITSTKLAANSVTAGAIVAGAISTYHLGAQVVTANQIAAGAITASKLSVDALDGKSGAFSGSRAYVSNGSWTLSCTNTASGASNGGIHSEGSGYGIVGRAIAGIGALGYSLSGTGVKGQGTTWGVYGETSESAGMWGLITPQKAYSGMGFHSPVAFNSFTGAHIAFTKDTLTVGDIVCVDSAKVDTIDQSIILVSKSSSIKSKAVMGVYSNNLASYEDMFKESSHAYIQDLLAQGYKIINVNSLGEGAMTVSDKGGNIAIGDYICTSSLKGKGMKQDDDLLHNYTVAKALESVDWSKETTTTKMIACTYHAG